MRAGHPWVLFIVVGLSWCSLQAAPDTAGVKSNLLNLDVKDTEIGDVIRMISKGHNLNILLDQGISGKVTLHLTEVPIMEGLRSIAESQGLEVVREGTVYKIQKATAERRSNIRYADGKLTVDIQNMDVKEFLKELSSKTAVSIVPDGKVDGKLSGKLYQVNLDDGLRALLEGNGFKVMKRRNIYQVLPAGDAGSSMQAPRYRTSSTPGSNFYVDYTNGMVTLDVSNGDLEDIVKAIAEQGDVEIVTYGSIKSEINAKLNNAPLTDALALLLGGTRFTFVQKDNVILIGDRNTATPSGQALSKSELVHLRHIKADNVPAILPKDIPATNVRVIKEQNALLISGTSEDIVAAREFLKTIDIPTPQVRIDAVIVEFKDNVQKELGFHFGQNERLQNKSYAFVPGPDTRLVPKRDHTEVGVSGSYLHDLADRLFDGRGFATVVRDGLPADFFGVLRMLESQDRAKVLAQPSVLTLNGNKASIDVSETQYFKIATGVAENYTLRFQPIKFGIQLDITPWISQSGQITAEITPNVSNSEQVNQDGYPNVSTRSITTTVRLNDGETLVLGGLIKDQETTFRNKIPFLGDLPIIGALFRNSGKNHTKTNLVVYITPHIVTRDERVNLKEELEKHNLRGKNFLERGFQQGTKKFRDMMNRSDADTGLADDRVAPEPFDTVPSAPAPVSDTASQGAASRQTPPAAVNAPSAAQQNAPMIGGKNAGNTPGEQSR